MRRSARLVADLNARIMRKLGVSRNELFAEIDRPALKALPSAPYRSSNIVIAVLDTPCNSENFTDPRVMRIGPDTFGVKGCFQPHVWSKKA